ncbi:GntR family transcriptional regulator [Acidobacteriota bacterium]
MKMFIVISPLNPDPMYKQITDQIKDAIAAGTMKAETKLPSIREMSKELKISMITIKRAYADLENKGYILTRSGMGSYIADINKDKLREEKLKEIRSELYKIRETAAKFDISEEDIIQIINESGEKK